jgi:hypothetical protein
LAAIRAGDLHAYASTTRSERFRCCDKLPADASAACMFEDDQSHDPTPRAGAFEERADVDRDEAEKVAVSIGNIGCTGGVVTPSLDSGRCCHDAILGIVQLVKQLVDDRGVGGVYQPNLHGFPLSLTQIDYPMRKSK